MVVETEPAYQAGDVAALKALRQSVSAARPARTGRR
jgi:hypothetical protein